MSDDFFKPTKKKKIHIDLNQIQKQKKNKKNINNLKNKNSKNQSKINFSKLNSIKILNLIFILIILFIFIFNGYLISDYTNNDSSISKSISKLAGNTIQAIDSVWEPSLKKTDNYTGILIMGIDSREVLFNGEQFEGKDRDIDSIIQVVINHDSGNIFMLSIPRDTGVTISEECVNQSQMYFKSINHAYRMAEDGGCKEGGAAIMKKYVTYITGFENHYHAIISYDAFRDIINTVGIKKDGEMGLYIEVPRNIQDYYPREQGHGFERVYFPQGKQFINSTDLLKYARVRRASSDFDRARRQQQVIEEMFDRILKSDLYSDPAKAFELYQAFRNNALYSELTIDDIRGALSLKNNIDKNKIYKFVLDDTFAGKNNFLTRPITSGGLHNRYGYYLSPVDFNDPECIEKKDEYCKVKNYLKQIFNNPDAFEEESIIYAYSNLKGISPQSDKFIQGKEKFKGEISISKYALPGLENFGDIQIFDFSLGNKPKTKLNLVQAFDADIIDGSAAPFERLNNEEFAIIVKMN